MGEAIGQTFVMAVAVGLSPIPIVGVVLMLSTPRGARNGIAFVAGWVVGLAGLGAFVLLSASGAGADDHASGPGWVDFAKLALGLLLLFVAAKQWRQRPGSGEEASLPRWMNAVDRLPVRRTVLLGAALAAVNPKNLILVVAGATTIAQSSASGTGQAIALAVFVAVGSVGTAGPLALHLTMRDRSERLLTGLKDWMARNNAAIMGVVCVLLAAKLIGDAISGLSA